MDLEDAPAAWVWIQKSKARALSDVFGVRALIPGALLQTIATDEEAQMLYEKERLSTEFAPKAGPLDYINARRKAESDHAEMRKHPLLAMALDIREGAFNVDFHESELNETTELCNVSRGAIKYVDWFIPTFKGRESKIMLLVRQLDGVTRSKVLEITITTVEAWIRRVFEFPEEAEPPLRRGDARALRWRSRLSEKLHMNRHGCSTMVMLSSTRWTCFELAWCSAMELIRLKQYRQLALLLIQNT